MSFKSGDIIAFNSGPEDYYLIVAHDEDQGDYWLRSLAPNYKMFIISADNFIRQEALYVDGAATLVSDIFRGSFEEMEEQVIKYIATRNFIYW